MLYEQKLDTDTAKACRILCMGITENVEKNVLHKGDTDDELLEYVSWLGAPTFLNDDCLKSLINEDISQTSQELSNKQYVLIKKICIRTYISLERYERKQMDPLWIYRLW